MSASTLTRDIGAIICYAMMIIMPVCLFSGLLGNPPFLAINCLAGIWMGLLFTAASLAPSGDTNA
jgi:hypothetical protein